MTIIRLPDRVQFSGLFEFQAFLSLNSYGQARVMLDFQDVIFYEYAAIALLLNHVHGLRNQSVIVDLRNFSGSAAFTYLQRINFFEHCALPLEEDFSRHHEAGRFVPFYRIGRGGHWNSDQVAQEISACLFPEAADSDDLEQSGIFDWMKYAISELIRNISQHSQSYGFAGAQYYPGQDSLQIVAVDCGIGILGSFEANRSPVFESGMDDLTAIHKALEVQVSSRDHISSAFGEVENAGVGLTLTVEMVNAIDGSFIVASGKGFVTETDDRLLGDREALTGTLCAISLSRNRIGSFSDLLLRAKKHTGLLPPNRNFGRFFK